LMIDFATARRVSMGNQGLRCPHHMRAAVHHQGHSVFGKSLQIKPKTS
jgi:hypothetical protein